MKKHYSYKQISKIKKKILEILIENEDIGLSLNEILEFVKGSKELILTSLDELLNYNAFVVLKRDDKFYFETKN